MKRRSNYVRTIPPWWANPIVFIPATTGLAIIAALLGTAFAVSVLR